MSNVKTSWIPLKKNFAFHTRRNRLIHLIDKLLKQLCADVMLLQKQ